MGSQVEYLVLHLPTNLDNSSEYGWDNYQELTSFCPNLKGILFYQKESGVGKYKSLIHLHSALLGYSLNTQNIWKIRIGYLISQNLRCISVREYKSMNSQRRNNLNVSWAFK